MRSVGLFAYGEMGVYALRSLVKKFNIEWVILPYEEEAESRIEGFEKLSKKYDIALLRPKNSKEVKKIIKKQTPDAVVIASYNQILPEEVLSLTKFINVHHGDLPRFRGRANINWAIILGRKEIGLTFHEAVADLDAGNIYSQYFVPIKPEDTIKTVYDKVNKIVERDLASIAVKVLDGYRGKPQKGRATYCCTRQPEDGYIDWKENTEDIHNLIRGLTHPFPGAFTFLENKKMFVWSSEIPKNSRVYEGRIPGRVVGIYPGIGVEVLTGSSSILLKDITIDGEERNASDAVRSVKKTLGINIAKLFEDIIELKER